MGDLIWIDIDGGVMGFSQEEINECIEEWNFVKRYSKDQFWDFFTEYFSEYLDGKRAYGYSFPH